MLCTIVGDHCGNVTHSSWDGEGRLSHDISNASAKQQSSDIIAKQVGAFYSPLKFKKY